MSINLNLGDHLVSSRASGLYRHHGIYIGSEKVIHYAGMSSGISKKKIEITSLQNFINDNDLEILKTKAAFPPSEIVKRAYSKLGEDKYNIFTNNCEHFANWCRTGFSESAQIKSAGGVSTTTVVTTVAAIIATPIFTPVATAVAVGAGVIRVWSWLSD